MNTLENIAPHILTVIVLFILYFSRHQFSGKARGAVGSRYNTLIAMTHRIDKKITELGNLAETDRRLVRSALISMSNISLNDQILSEDINYDAFQAEYIINSAIVKTNISDLQNTGAPLKFILANFNRGDHISIAAHIFDILVSSVIAKKVEEDPRSWKLGRRSKLTWQLAKQNESRAIALFSVAIADGQSTRNRIADYPAR